jgi:hypothetical protein
VERRADQPHDLAHGVGGRQVLGEVARVVPPHEGEVRTGLERDGTDDDFLERRVVAAGLAERQPRERAGAHALIEAGGEIILGRCAHHRLADIGGK